jgi:hypothetical protein
MGKAIETKKTDKSKDSMFLDVHDDSSNWGNSGHFNTNGSNDHMAFMKKFYLGKMGAIGKGGTKGGDLSHVGGDRTNDLSSLNNSTVSNSISKDRKLQLMNKLKLSTGNTINNLGGSQKPFNYNIFSNNVKRTQMKVNPRFASKESSPEYNGSKVGGEYSATSGPRGGSVLPLGGKRPKDNSQRYFFCPLKFTEGLRNRFRTLKIKIQLPPKQTGNLPPKPAPKNSKNHPKTQCPRNTTPTPTPMKSSKPT